MKTAVVYSSRSGNTREVAQVVAEELRALGEVSLLEAESAEVGADIDLLVVGGPTEGHGLTPPVREFFARLGRLRGVRAAAFDTRLHWPLWLSGSAGREIALELQRLGANLVLPPESFLVTMAPKLRPGELERAARWARSLVEAGLPVPA